MSSNSKTLHPSPLFPRVGAGVGLRGPHYPHFLDGRPRSVDWVEAITETFLPWKNHPHRRPLEKLLEIRKNVPIALHGVSLSIGSADPLDREYLKHLKALVDVVEPLWLSDHLCWTGVDGVNMHDLLPVPFTQGSLKRISEKILRVQDALGRRILIENVSSYIEYSYSDASEWQFLRELSERADCGLLLDVNNVYVSSINHGFDAHAFMRALPAHRVGQIHLAGHTTHDDYLVDTHDAPVCDAVWELYDWSVGHFGAVPAMIERDGRIPEWCELEQEVWRMKQLMEKDRMEGETHAHERKRRERGKKNAQRCEATLAARAAARA